MTLEDRWMLPDGVEELLPDQARQVEFLRRKLLDLYSSWGYQLVIPPLMEFTESLLIGLSQDVDLQTFKVVDQLSGRTMGIRADISPQTSRMDAHSLGQSGPTRLCYAGSVLHTKPKSLLASRSPIQLGAELYGVAGLDADIEIISLMLETLSATGLRNCFIELGHVGIFRALARMANLAPADEQLLFNALQRKAASEINQLISATVADTNIATMLRELAKLNGDLSIIEKARVILKDAPAVVKEALTELETVAHAVAERMPGTEFHVDLSELRGYNYHTGIVFATYSLGFGQAIAKGGRYDDVGTVFGRHRPATGFDCDLKAFLSLTENRVALPRAIFAAEAKTPAVWQKICELRATGERVICGLAGQVADYEELGCDRQLVKEGDQFVIKPI